jgi:hypothetical protein
MKAFYYRVDGFLWLVRNTISTELSPPDHCDAKQHQKTKDYLIERYKGYSYDMRPVYQPH